MQWIRQKERKNFNTSGHHVTVVFLYSLYITIHHTPNTDLCEFLSPSSHIPYWIVSIAENAQNDFTKSYATIFGIKKEKENILAKQKNKNKFWMIFWKKMKPLLFISFYPWPFLIHFASTHFLILPCVYLTNFFFECVWPRKLKLRHFKLLWI